MKHHQYHALETSFNIQSNSAEVLLLSVNAFEASPLFILRIRAFLEKTLNPKKNSGQNGTARSHIDQGKWRSSALFSLYFNLQVVDKCKLELTKRLGQND